MCIAQKRTSNDVTNRVEYLFVQCPVSLVGVLPHATINSSLVWDKKVW